MNKQHRLALLPSVDALLNHEKIKNLKSQYAHFLIKQEIQHSIDEIKSELLRDTDVEPTREVLSQRIIERTMHRLQQELLPSLRPVINATGIILHTGLGRAPLSSEVQENVVRVIKGYSNLEIDMQTGKRGQRNDHVSNLLRRLTGAEAAVIVNNNAAAVFLSLNTMAFGREAIISRGQLIEIGGAFRMPDVMEKSGVMMKEIGTTNKTKLSDYEKAITGNTGVIVVAHTSNYRVLGFTAEVALKDLADLAHSHGLPLLHDLGGGVIVDLERFGLPYEPLVQDSLKAGADVVTFSGDKVLGGPQSGIIVGKKEWIEKIHANPIMRAVRCDKMTYAALEATLKIFLQNDFLERHRTLRLLTEPVENVLQRAKKLVEMISPSTKSSLTITIEEGYGQTGSGALPLEKIPSATVALSAANRSAEALASALRSNEPPIVGYIKNERVYLDMRTVEDDELELIAKAIRGLE